MITCHGKARLSVPKNWASSGSLLESLETVESLSFDSFYDKSSSPLKPSDQKFMFQTISAEAVEYYGTLFEKLSKTLGELEEALPSVDIRDDCSIKAKPVFVRLPDRRKTQPAK